MAYNQHDIDDAYELGRSRGYVQALEDVEELLKREIESEKAIAGLCSTTEIILENILKQIKGFIS